MNRQMIKRMLVVFTTLLLLAGAAAGQKKDKEKKKNKKQAATATAPAPAAAPTTAPAAAATTTPATPAAAAAPAATGAAATAPAAAAPAATSTTVTKAIAVLHPTEGNKVRGWVSFTKDAAGVKVVIHIEGLAPGKHGFHVHEWGDCSAKDGLSTGYHHNPVNKAHGAPSDAARHIGDLGNIEAGPDGTAHVEFTDPMLTLEGANTIIGRGVIVHAQADDLKSQPAGNAGPRQACGVIGVAKP